LRVKNRMNGAPSHFQKRQAALSVNLWSGCNSGFRHAALSSPDPMELADHRLALSGTPIENHLGELWSLFELLNPGLLDKERVSEPSAKLDMLLPRVLEVIEEGHKMLVFSQFFAK